MNCAHITVANAATKRSIDPEFAPELNVTRPRKFRKRTAMGNTPIFVANVVGSKYCTVPGMDVDIPDPGSNVVVTPSSYKKSPPFLRPQGMAKCPVDETQLKEAGINPESLPVPERAAQGPSTTGGATGSVEASKFDPSLLCPLANKSSPTQRNVSVLLNGIAHARDGSTRVLRRYWDCCGMVVDC